MNKLENDKLYAIKEIKRYDEHAVFVDNFDDVEKAVLSAIFAGLFGLLKAGPILINNVQIADFSNYPAAMNALIGVSCAFSVYYIGVCIKDKIKNILKIKELREGTGLTKEEQEKFLEELVKEGNQDAVNLYDYFYGEKKRKAL